MVVVAVELLFAADGSVVADDTDAVFDVNPPKLTELDIVVVITFDAPGAIVERSQGYGVTHAPALLTNVNPAGAGSATVTSVATDGPLFVTVMV